MRVRLRGVGDDRCDLLCLDLEKAEGLRSDRLDGDVAVQVAARAKALSDPTRLTIAAALAATDELCVCDLAWSPSAPRISSPTTPEPCARLG